MFATTHWSLVRRAAGPDSQVAQAALGALYETYAYPLYAYLRRRGQSPEESQDLVHQLFLDLLAKDQLAHVSPDKGRFRSYLLSAANHALANEWARRSRQKRGGGELPVSLDALAAEERYRQEPADRQTPEKAFEQRWALALLERVLARLETEWTTAGRADAFRELRGFLTGDHDLPGYAELGRRLGQSEGATRVAVHRLRQRYRDLLRAEIARTVDTAAEVEDELRHLLIALRG